MTCKCCGADRFYTVAKIDGRDRLAVKCMNSKCGHVERAPDQIVMERAAGGRIR